MGIMFKIAGPQIIAGKHFDFFAKFTRVTVFCALLLPPLIIGAVIPFRHGMAFNYGGNACTYAKDSDCLPFFTNIFGRNGRGGEYTLQFTFDVFAAGASIDAVSFVLRSILLACADCDFMLIATGAAVLVYIPTIVVAALVPPFAGQAVSFFVAMYVPQFILTILFLLRIEILVRRMVNGERGSWNNHRNTVVGSLRKLQVESERSSVSNDV